MLRCRTDRQIILVKTPANSSRYVGAICAVCATTGPMDRASGEGGGGQINLSVPAAQERSPLRPGPPLAGSFM